MKKFLIPQSGNFYKANLHTHTTISDGRLTPEETKKEYLKKGISIVAFTDHDVFIPHNDLTDDNFLALNGFEVEINQPFGDKHRYTTKCCHICFVSLDKNTTKQICWHREKYLFSNAVNYRDKVDFDDTLPDYEREYSPECISEMMKIGRDNGFFVTYNHPTWSGETFNEYLNYENMHALEIHNSECCDLGIEEHNERVYDDMLRAGKKLYCVATDDMHRLVSLGKGWISIKADELEYSKITNAMLKGHFYASTGPEILELYVEDDTLHVKTSPACKITLTAFSRFYDNRSDETGGLTQASFKISPQFDCYRLTIVDKDGKRAYTNAYSVNDLLK